MCGLARVLRANSIAAMENVALWHERDISHSSVERVIGPDSTILLHYMLRKMTGLVKNMIVYPKSMRKNMEITGGLYYSQSVLLALVRKGLSREDAYSLVQQNAMKAWEGKGAFISLLKKDSEIKKYLSGKELDKVCNMKDQLKNIDKIFKRVFKNKK
jgi:adenylosuccinate lyase